MNPILYVIYKILRQITIVLLRIYFPKTTVVNGDRFRFKRPSIVVSNHPNTLIDPLNAAWRVPMVVHFLAYVGLFKHWFTNWLFNTLYCIPVTRQQDANGNSPKNENSFEACYTFLGNGGCLYIAPEGTSYMERRLRPVKTGTARIALETEKRHDYDLGLSILPVGLTYDQPDRFRSRLFIKTGAPIWIKDYRAAYEADPQQAVKHLTREMDTRLRSLLIDTKDDEEDAFLYKMETLLRNSQPLPEEQHFERSQQLLIDTRAWQESEPESKESFQADLNRYFEQLEKQPFSDESVVHAPSQSRLNAHLILGFPLYIYGYVNNFLPAWLSDKMVKWLKLFNGYDTTVRMLSGLVFFPLFYFLQTKLVLYWADWKIAVAYLLSLLPSGLYTLQYRDRLKKWFKARQFLRWQKKETAQADQLKDLRRKLIQQLAAMPAFA
ncbi:MAG TPA: 1-acyl-sn-glycerol-3-phosphate acyltransferase [Saprospiraceae bacterium]|nr:1-acyl-sn-glycerol-3-phosphate acyltransferase [Saprospiraceae bacterium]HMQ82420.1 1-acyl-sn-glycerol-3-phosphate acyltransferase [Saprospiraceae bacterium]